MEIYFWQNCISPHQAAVINSLSSSHDVTLITEEDLPDWRKEMGWEIPILGNTKLIVNPSNNEILDIINKSHKKSIHIFSGINSYKKISLAFKKCIKKGLKIGIMSEARDIEGGKGCLRIIKGKIECIRYNNKIDFILAIGHLGVNYFKKIGFPEKKIYPYGYFIDENIFLNVPPRKNNNGIVRIYFVGRCIYMKGIDILIKALEKIDCNKWELNIIGDGEYKDELINLTKQLGLKDNINFHGRLTNKETISMLSNADLLVLPSRKKEGWGAVINEALMSGVPVICSDKCGASIMFKNNNYGEVFKSESIEDLRRILNKKITEGISSEEFVAIKKWSKCISGSNAAEYIIKIIDNINLGSNDKPLPPWE